MKIDRSTYFPFLFGGVVGGLVADTSVAHFSYALVDFISPEIYKATTLEINIIPHCVGNKI